jgi:hypothetical protein
MSDADTDEASESSSDPESTSDVSDIDEPAVHVQIKVRTIVVACMLS